MKEADVARILLARAFEDRHPRIVPEDVVAAAEREAGDCESIPAWYLRRADALLARLPRRDAVPFLLRLRDPADGAAWIVLALGLLAGLVSNEVGPDGRIHLLFNPLLGLVAWNLGLYAMLAGRAVRSLARRAPGPRAAPPAPLQSEPPVTAQESGPSPAVATAPEDRATWPDGTPRLLRLFVRGALGSRWLRWKAWQADLRASADEEAALAAVTASFLSNWLRVARSVVLLRVERLFHVGALGLVSGAIAGMYFRGLFLDYNVVWRSTFVRSEETIAALLQLMLGPAARVLGFDLAAQLRFDEFLSDAGAPAAPWIHLYGLTALMVVVVPRTLLFAWDSLRIRSLASRIEPGFGEDYFQLRLHWWRETRRQEVVSGIRQAYVDEVAKMAAKIGDFVCANLYDGPVVRDLEAFRGNGGRLADLEERIRLATETFGGELELFVRQAQRELEGDLATTVRASLVKSLGPSLGFHESGADGGLGDGRYAGGELVGSIGGSIADTVGLAVSAAVAVALGTVSGGFGKSLGVAVLVGLVHSGPLAFVLGALGGLFAAGAGLWLGRDALSTAVKEYALPATLTRAVLWPSRMRRIVDEGREKTRAAVNTKVRDAMEPMAETVAEQVWRGIDPPRWS